MNIKDIAATLAILGSGTLVMTGCGKPAATEVPAGDEAAPVDGAEASCAGEGHTEEGHCGGADGADEAAEGSCSGEDAAEGSCSGEKAEGEASCSGAS